jgi:membrane protease subunit HflC
LTSFALRLIIGLGVAGLLIASACCVPVPEGHAAVITRLGEPVREVLEAGPVWKLPWPIERAYVIDRRSRLFSTPYTATFTRDKRNVILLSYVVWRVEEPLLFLQAAGTPEQAERKLDGMVTAAKNVQLGRWDLAALVSTTPGAVQAEAIEAAILSDVRPTALAKLGVTVEQVGFKRIAFPEENVPAVLAHMRSERKAEAGKLRAEGEREAQAIRDDTLVRTEETLRQGREEAGKIRGRAEKDAAEIYAQVHRQDPEFYRFWRGLEAVKKVLGAKSTLILRTDQGFFDVLGDNGRPKGAAVTAPPPLATPALPPVQPREGKP